MNRSKTNSYRALLVDLDGTLLKLDIEKFIPAYIEALSMRFTDLIEKEEFIRHLFLATNVMIQNDEPDKKNRTVFYEEFCRRIGKPYELIDPIVEDFYRRDFPGLSCWGEEHPYSRRLIESARNKDLILVLATNPLFPPAAIRERMSWGGLSEEDFHLVTTMNNMHFCKPKPQYFLEVADKIGCSPEQCLMAGNDTLEDLSASEAGMATFLVNEMILHRAGNEPVYDYIGSLKELVEFVESGSLNPEKGS